MPTERGFTGRPHDATGLVYMNARYYDPAIGQFISPDTVVPDPTVVMDYNRYLYARANPLRYNDPTGHCPAPDEDMGAIICVALFIEPSTIEAGGITVGGDGRSFDNDSDPAASRGWAWIDANTGEFVQPPHMNPSKYPTAGPLQYRETPPSEVNTWAASMDESGVIILDYDLVLSGSLELYAPHINGTVSFAPNDKGSYDTSFKRDGFPWAEAYYHDGEGNVETLFQDPAIRGNPHDLFAIEPSLASRPLKWAGYFLGRSEFGLPQISAKP